MGTPINVVGSYLTVAGNPASGVVTFELTDTINDGTEVHPPVVESAVLGVDGSFSILLSGSSGSGINPTGVLYRIVEDIDGVVEPRWWFTDLDADGPAKVDIKDFAPSIPGPQDFTYALTSSVTALTVRVDGLAQDVQDVEDLYGPNVASKDDVAVVQAVADTNIADIATVNTYLAGVVVKCVTDGAGGYQVAFTLAPVPAGVPRTFVGPDDPSGIAGITLSAYADAWSDTTPG